MVSHTEKIFRSCKAFVGAIWDEGRTMTGAIFGLAKAERKDLEAS